MDDAFVEVRQLFDEKMRAPFPDCRGDEIDGVDLVMVDADLAGAMQHFLGKAYRSDDFQLGILRKIAHDLDRIAPTMTGEVAAYFDRERRLAHATLTAVTGER